MNIARHAINIYQKNQAVTMRDIDKIIAFYNKAIELINKAKSAIEDKKIEEKFNFLDKATQIMLGLLNSLDFENGGVLSQSLYLFYQDMILKITKLNYNEDIIYCEKIIEEIQTVLDSWKDIKSSA